MNSAALLAAWEEGLSQPAPQRAVSLLAAACPEHSEDEWAEATIGERDGRLLRLREQLFGSRLDATAQCPECSERLELSFSTDDIRVSAPADSGLVAAAEGCQVRFRLPNSIDLLEAGRSVDPERALLARCVSDTNVALLPPEVVRTVAERMAEADPQADVQIALSCPNCGHGWSMPFDIVSYLWGEIEDWARHLLIEVHSLASAYHWSEQHILAMSPRRRRMYLDMVGA